MQSLLSNSFILFTFTPTLSQCQIDKYFSLRRVTHQEKKIYGSKYYAQDYNLDDSCGFFIFLFFRASWLNNVFENQLNKRLKRHSL